MIEVLRCTICGEWGERREMFPVNTRIGKVMPIQTTRWFHRKCIEGEDYNAAMETTHGG